MHIVNAEGAINSGGKWLLVKRSDQEEHAAGEIALVGGKVDIEEAASDVLEKTLIREIQEEIGIHVSGLKYVNSSTFATGSGICVVDIVFLCQHVSGMAYAKSSSEVAEVLWLTTEEIINSGNLPDYLKKNIKAAEKIRKSEML